MGQKPYSFESDFQPIEPYKPYDFWSDFQPYQEPQSQESTSWSNFWNSTPSSNIWSSTPETPLPKDWWTTPQDNRPGYPAFSPGERAPGEPYKPQGVNTYGKPVTEGDIASDILTVPNALRFGVPAAVGVAGSTLGPWTGAGLAGLAGGASEAAARWYEGKPFDWGINTVEGGLNAIPGLAEVPGKGAGLRQLLKFGTGQVAEGTLQGVLGTGPRKWADEGTLFSPSKWTMPSSEEFTREGVAGGVFGGGFGTALGGAHMGYKNDWGWTPHSAALTPNAGELRLGLDKTPERKTIENTFKPEIYQGWTPEQRAVVQANLDAKQDFPTDRMSFGYESPIGRQPAPESESFRLGLDPGPPMAPDQSGFRLHSGTPQSDFRLGFGEFAPAGPDSDFRLGFGDTAPRTHVGESGPMWPGPAPAAPPMTQGQALADITPKGPRVQKGVLQYNKDGSLTVPNELITDAFIAKRAEGGQTVVEKGPTHTTFRKPPGGTSAGMFISPEAIELIKNRLRRMLGREPNETEIRDVAEREVRPGEQTGAVAPFPPRVPPRDVEAERRNAIDGRRGMYETPRDLYRLPDGRIVSVDASATKGVQTTEFGMKDGSFVNMTYVGPRLTGDRIGPDGYVIPFDARTAPVSDLIGRYLQVSDPHGGVASPEAKAQLNAELINRLKSETDPRIAHQNLGDIENASFKSRLPGASRADIEFYRDIAKTTARRNISGQPINQMLARIDEMSVPDATYPIGERQTVEGELAVKLAQEKNPSIAQRNLAEIDAYRKAAQTEGQIERGDLLYSVAEDTFNRLRFGNMEPVFQGPQVMQEPRLPLGPMGEGAPPNRQSLQIPPNAPGLDVGPLKQRSLFGPDPRSSSITTPDMIQRLTGEVRGENDFDTAQRATDFWSDKFTEGDAGVEPIADASLAREQAIRRADLRTAEAPGSISQLPSGWFEVKNNVGEPIARVRTQVEAEQALRELNITEAIPGIDEPEFRPSGQQELPWSRAEGGSLPRGGDLLAEPRTSRGEADLLMRRSEDERTGPVQQSMAGELGDSIVGKFLYDEGMAGGTASARENQITSVTNIEEALNNYKSLPDGDPLKNVALEHFRALARAHAGNEFSPKVQNIEIKQQSPRSWGMYVDGKLHEGGFSSPEAAARAVENYRRKLDPNYKTPQDLQWERDIKQMSDEELQRRRAMLEDREDYENPDIGPAIKAIDDELASRRVDAEIDAVAENGTDTPGNESGVKEKIQEITDKIIDDIIKPPEGGTTASMAFDPRALQLIIRDIQDFLNRKKAGEAPELPAPLARLRDNAEAIRQREADTKEADITHSIEETEQLRSRWSAEYEQARQSGDRDRQAHATRMVGLATRRLRELHQTAGRQGSIEVYNRAEGRVLGTFYTREEASRYRRNHVDMHDLEIRSATEPEARVEVYDERDDLVETFHNISEADAYVQSQENPADFEMRRHGRVVSIPKHVLKERLRNPTGPLNPPIEFGHTPIEESPRRAKLAIPPEQGARLQGIAELDSPTRMRQQRHLAQLTEAWVAKNRELRKQGLPDESMPDELFRAYGLHQDDWDDWAMGKLNKVGNGLPGLTVADVTKGGGSIPAPPGGHIYHVIWRDDKGIPVSMAEVHERFDGVRTLYNLASDRSQRTRQSRGFKAVVEQLSDMNALEADSVISQFTARWIAQIMKHVRGNGGTAGMFGPIKVLTDILTDMARSGKLKKNAEGRPSYEIQSIDDAVNLHEVTSRDKRGALGFFMSKISDVTGGERGAVEVGKMWGDLREKAGWGTGARGADTIQSIKEKFGWDQGKKDAEGENQFIKEALAFSSAATTTGDFSAPGRQGLSMILTKEFWQAASAMFGGLTPKGFDQIDEALRDMDLFRPTVKADGSEGPSFGEQIGMKLFQPAERMGPRAEATASRWLETGGFLGPENIGGVTNPLRAGYKHTIGYPVRATNRMFITFLNHLNANRTKFLLDRLEDMSLTALTKGEGRKEGILGDLGFKQKYTPEQAMNLNPYQNLDRAKEIADFVNTATGHAPLRTYIVPFKGTEINLESAASLLSKTMFSPGLFFSRFRMLSPANYIMATPFVRKQYLKAAFSTAAAWFAFAQLGKLASPDAEINDDWTNADFGKVRIGDTRMDVSGGFAQFITLFGRLVSGGYTSSKTGQFHEFGQGFQAETRRSTAERFMVNKLNPLAKFVYDWADATQYKPMHMGDRTMQLFTPLIVQDIIGIASETPDLLPMIVPAMFGMGTQTYSKGESVGKLIAPENDWIYTGGGDAREFIPEEILENQPFDFLNPRMEQ